MYSYSKLDDTSNYLMAASMCPNLHASKTFLISNLSSLIIHAGLQMLFLFLILGGVFTIDCSDSILKEGRLGSILCPYENLNCPGSTFRIDSLIDENELKRELLKVMKQL